MTGPRMRRGARWMASRGVTSARPASPIWPEWRPRGVAKWIVDHVKNKHRYIPPKGPELRKGPRPSRAATTSSCQGTQRLATACAIKSTSCRPASADSAARTRGRPATTCSRTARPGSPRSRNCGKTWAISASGSISGRPEWSCASATKGQPKRCCPSFGKRTLNRWSLSHPGVGERKCKKAPRGRGRGGREGGGPGPPTGLL